jgi:hypothetical protein
MPVHESVKECVRGTDAGLGERGVANHLAMTWATTLPPNSGLPTPTLI